MCHTLRYIVLFFLIIALSPEVNAEVKKTALTNTLEFIENKGQLFTQEKILFYGQLSNMSVFFRKSGVSYVMKEGDEDTLLENNNTTNKKNKTGAQLKKGHRIDLDFLNTSPALQIVSENPGNNYSNYFYPHCPEGITEVKSFGKISYRNIYPNIDIVFFGGSEKGMEYDIVVRPGGDPTNIKYLYKGANDLYIEDDKLKIKTSIGELEESMPRIYQQINGTVNDVDAQYILNGTTVSLQLGSYNIKLPLIIDPWITYFGGNNMDAGTALAMDNNGELVYTGFTNSTVFPTSPGAYDITFGGGTANDIILVKFSPSGTRVWATYYGGTGATYSEAGLGIAIESSNNILICGSTSAPNIPMPGTNQTFGGSMDAFVARFSAAGNLMWGTYLGGSAFDRANDIGVDNAGNIFVTGETKSANFPVLSAVYSTLNNSSLYNDIFIIKYNSSGSIVWSTYYGGDNNDVGMALDIDNANNIIVAGYTNTTNTTFPVLNAQQPTHAGGVYDYFILKMNNAGTPLWATYVGGISDDYSGIDVDTDSGNNIIITGSGGAGFPVTLGAFQQTNAGGTIGLDITISKFNSLGILLWSTFIGGTNDEYAASVVVDAHDNIFICGGTYSPDFPVTACSNQTTYGGGLSDMYIAKFNSAGNLICSGFLSGPNMDMPLSSSHSIVTDGIRYIYVLGAETGNTFPVTPGAYQINNNGMRDIVLAQLCDITCGIYNSVLDFTASKVSVCVGDTISFSVMHKICDTTNAVFLWTFTGPTTFTSSAQNPSAVKFNTAGVYNVKLLIKTLCENDSLTKTAYITVNAFPVMSVHGNTLICSGSNSVLTASGANTYLWFPAIGINSTTGAVVTANPSVNTTYTIIGTNAGGCSSTAYVSVSVSQPMTINTSSTNVLCFGQNSGTASVVATGGIMPYTYSWSNGNTTSALSGVNAGSYTLTVSDAANCISSPVVIGIAEPSPISYTLTTVDANCNQSNGSAILNVTGGLSPYTYSWSNGQSGNAATSLSASIYTVTVNDNNGCSSITQATIGNISGITANVIVNSNVSCNGFCDGVALALVTGGTAPYSYLWSNAQTNAQASALCAGVYSLTITDNTNCSDIISVTITEPFALAFASAITDASCYGIANGSATIALQGGTAPYNYLWSNGQTGQGATGLAAGNYSVAVTDGNGCSSSFGITIGEPGALQISVNSVDARCGNNNGHATATVTGGVFSYNYQWSTTPIQTTPHATGLAPGNYSLTVTDANGCSASVSTTVNGTPPSVVSFIQSDTAACGKICVDFTNTSPNTNSLTWNFGDGNVSSAQFVNHCYTQPGNYAVTLMVTDNNGCTATITKNNLIHVYPVPAAAFSFSPLSPTVLTPVNFIDQSVGAIKWQWNFGDENASFSSNQNPVFSYTNSGCYPVELVIKNEYGCIDSAEIEVCVKEEYSLYVPNTFTPNGDGVNDLFFPKGAGINTSQFEMYIFDRWGNLIYKTTDINKGWDGRANGGMDIAQTDTYVWKIVERDIYNQPHSYTGHVNLIK